MDSVGAEVDGAVWPEEVVEAGSKLWRKVPDAGIGRGAVGELVVDRSSADGGILMIRPDQPTPSLGPGNHLAVARAGEVPSKKDRGDGDAGVGSSGLIGGGADAWRGARSTLEARSVGLPEGEDLDGVFEVAMQNAGAYVGDEDLPSVPADHEELEVASTVSDSDASLGEDAEVQRAVRGGEGGGCGGFCLRGGRGRG